jgi:hypothetical protein
MWPAEAFDFDLHGRIFTLPGVFVNTARPPHHATPAHFSSLRHPSNGSAKGLALPFPPATIDRAHVIDLLPHSASKHGEM